MYKDNIRNGRLVWVKQGSQTKWALAIIKRVAATLTAGKGSGEKRAIGGSLRLQSLHNLREDCVVRMGAAIMFAGPDCSSSSAWRHGGLGGKLKEGRAGEVVEESGQSCIEPIELIMPRLIIDCIARTAAK